MNLPADPTLERFWTVGISCFLVSLAALFTPWTTDNRSVFWGSLGVFVVFAFIPSWCLSRVIKLRGINDAQLRQLRSRRLWLGPLGVLATLWDLTRIRAHRG